MHRDMPGARVVLEPVEDREPRVIGQSHVSHVLRAH